MSNLAGCYSILDTSHFEEIGLRTLKTVWDTGRTKLNGAYQIEDCIRRCALPRAVLFNPICRDVARGAPVQDVDGAIIDPRWGNKAPN